MRLATGSLTVIDRCMRDPCGFDSGRQKPGGFADADLSAKVSDNVDAFRETRNWRECGRRDVGLENACRSHLNRNVLFLESAHADPLRVARTIFTGKVRK